MHRSVGVGNHIAVRENHTLGLPGSARCIDDLSAVISIRVDGLEKHRMALHDLPETVIHTLSPCGQRSLFAFNGNHTFYVGHCFAGRNFIQVSAPSHQYPSTSVRSHELHLLALAHGGDGDRDSPYFQDPVEGDGELCAVAHEEAHAITFHHTQLRESVGEAISVATKLRVCPAAISVDQRLVVREKDGIPVQRIRYIHQLLLLPSSVCLSQSISCSRARTRMPIIQLRGASTPYSSPRSVTARFSVSISVRRPASTSCSMEILLSPTPESALIAKSAAFSNSAKSRPWARATSPVSSARARINSLVGANSISCLPVNPVSAATALQDTLANNLRQIGIRISPRIRWVSKPESLSIPINSRRPGSSVPSNRPTLMPPTPPLYLMTFNSRGMAL